MTKYLNGWEDKPCDIIFEDLEKQNEDAAMMLQQLARPIKKRPYVDGSYIGVWAFAIYVKVEAADSSSRLGAVSVLNCLGEWMTAADEFGRFTNLPVIDDFRTANSISMTSSPSLLTKNEDGTDTYQAQFELEYLYRR